MTYPMQQPPNRSPFGSPAVLAAIVGGVVVLVVGATAAILYAKNDTSNDQQAAGTSTSAPHSTITITQSGRVTTTTVDGGTPGNGGNGGTTAGTPSPTVPDRPDPNVSGADWQGFPGSFARCNAADDPAVFIGYTNRSNVVICRVGADGGLYYKGEADGNGKEISFPTRSGDTFVATSGNVSYNVSPSTLTIYRDGTQIASEPMIQSWSD